MNTEHVKKQVRALLAQVHIEEWEREDLLGRVEGSLPEQLEKLLDNLMRQLSLDITEDYLKEIEENTQLYTEENRPDVDKILDERLQQMKEKLFTEAEIDQIRSHIAEIAGTPPPVTPAAPMPDVIAASQPVVPAPLVSIPTESLPDSSATAPLPAQPVQSDTPVSPSPQTP